MQMNKYNTSVDKYFKNILFFMFNYDYLKSFYIYIVKAKSLHTTGYVDYFPTDVYQFENEVI